MSVSTISLGKLYIDGVACVNPEIVSWEALNDCTNITCLLENGDIKIQVVEAEGCELPCVRVTLKCNDGCEDCGTVTRTYCLCDSIDDCAGCDICNEAGICVNKPCAAGKKINPDNCDCVDCVVDGDCPCNQECQPGGGCACADPSHIIDEKGCCVECITADDCEGCDQCIGKACVPKTCGEGLVLDINNCTRSGAHV